MTDRALPEPLLEALGYRFRDLALLERALTHASLGDRRHHTETNERLEFLGDRVLGLVVSELLLESYPEEAEGAIARRYADLVRRETLARVAEEIALGDALRLSTGEAATGGRGNPAVLADACEAVIGAMYLDGGLAPARTFVRTRWADFMREWAEPPQDPKTGLQEWAQGRGLPLPEYRMVKRAGPPHKPVFRIEVTVAGEAPATGEGGSKREAERLAAVALLERLAPGATDRGTQ